MTRELAGIINDIVPIQRRTGIGFVCLNVVVADDAFVSLQFRIRKFLGD